MLVNNSSGLPLFYPNLFITTQVRNRSLSYSTMEATLSGISVLLRYMEERGESLEERFQKVALFKEHELDAIRDFCQIKFRSQSNENSNGMFNLSELREFDEKVSSQTEYVRLTIVAQYTKWLAEQFIANSKDKLTVFQIGKIEKGIKARRPVKKNRNAEQHEKGLDDEQLDLLFEILRPDSPLNPFADKSVRIRNRLIIFMLYHLGLRGGELLNIRIRDIDFGKNQLIVARRADEKDDPRTYQPLVKTLDRRLPMNESLVQEIHHYVLSVRKKIPNSKKNDFLFVTHKSGRTQGQPLSKSGYKKILEVVRKASPSLFNLAGHQLRHTWNEKFSDRMNTMDKPISPEEQEKMRSYLMGWKEGSGTAAHYNKRFVKKKANEAALKLQEGMIRVPKGGKQ
ncbi:tyrosine-type recombinase/integrase [Methylobacter sp.]|uniref:tyrosine-type recombinase/integrase n=1 Tax=Methylobacter sp. TaxID=2051955 RepID=UPI002FDEA458